MTEHVCICADCIGVRSDGRCRFEAALRELVTALEEKGVYGMDSEIAKANLAVGIRT